MILVRGFAFGCAIELEDELVVKLAEERDLDPLVEAHGRRREVGARSELVS